MAAPKLRVLIVEDDQDAANSLALLVGLWGHDARIANDGPAALALAQALEPHVALLDLGLPRMDGFEVARRLTAAHPGTVLIAVSAYGDALTRMHSKEIGFVAHFVKPADLQGLQQLLAQRQALLEL